jgi:hypothetical protein
LRSVGTKLRDDEYQALVERAREEGVKPYELVRRAILAYLNLPAREPSRDEILDKLSELEKRIIALEQAVFKQAGANSPQTQTVEQSSKPRKTAWDILREQEIVCASAMKHARDPERIIEGLKKNGAVIFVSEDDRCAVYPDTWTSFMEGLAKISSPDEREVLGRLKGKAKQLFKMLRAAGATHFDNKSKVWVVDTNVIERGEESPGLEEVRREKAGGKYVVRIPKEEVEDVESYISGMEHGGYLCNEKGEEVVCVWREVLEQALIDLNNSKATNVGGFEKVLANDMVKLEISKAAYEAGLLWYDGKQRKWRIAS